MKLMNVIFSSICFVLLNRCQTQDSDSEAVIVKYREMTVSLYGKTKTPMRNSEYSMRVSLNDLKDVIYSPIAIDDSDQLFRIDQTLDDNLEKNQLQKLFVKDLHLKIEFFKSDDATMSVIIYDGQTNLFPDSTEDFNATVNNLFEVEVFTISLKCYGYTGYNCRFDAIDDKDVTTDFETGETLCKDAKSCIAEDPSCDPKDNKCMNNGECHIDQTAKRSYCICSKGFSGPYCQFDGCEFDEDEIMFGERTEFCDITECPSSQNKCQNNGQCQKHGEKFIRCKCDNKSFAGKHCEKKCQPECGVDEYCTIDHEDKEAYCYPLKEPKVIKPNTVNETSQLTYADNKNPLIFGSIFVGFSGLVYSMLKLSEMMSTSEDCDLQIFQKMNSLKFRESCRQKEIINHRSKSAKRVHAILTYESIQTNKKREMNTIWS